MLENWTSDITYIASVHVTNIFFSIFPHDLLVNRYFCPAQSPHSKDNSFKNLQKYTHKIQGKEVFHNGGKLRKSSSVYLLR